MHIQRVLLRTLRLRLREPFRTSSGVTTHRTFLLVQIFGDGTHGVAECVAGTAPTYTAETIETARWVLQEHLVPAVLGATIPSAADVGAVLDRAARGHTMAKAAIEMAAWDADARARRVPLAEIVGGSRDTVPVGISLGFQEDLAALLERVEHAVDAGYRRVKLKIEPGRDLDLLDAVRQNYPDLPLTVDANGSYTEADLDRLTRLDDYDLLYFEQPFAADALVAHAELQERLATPVCLDESITGRESCRTALAMGACGVVNVKPGRVGGHRAARDIHDLCRAAGVPVWCGGMLESGVGRAHNVALATLPGFTLPGDLSASRRYWERDIVVPPFELAEEGMMPVPTGPGIGVELDEEFIRTIEIDRREFT